MAEKANPFPAPERQSEPEARTLPNHVDLTEYLFPEAAMAWLETRRPHLAKQTHRDYGVNIRTLSKFFGSYKLTEIGYEDIRRYQVMRMAQVSSVAVNHETCVLNQMLKRVGRWERIQRFFQPLPLPKEKRGRAMTPEQKERLFRLAKSNPNWEAAKLFALLSVNTTLGPKETATLRLKDLDLERRLLMVQPEGAKNFYRIRAIPLNDEAFEAVREALQRANKLGSVKPEHYLFPFRVNRSLFDPRRHITSFKGAWKRMIAAAELPGFRMYDMRHSAITYLLEDPQISEEVAEAIAGHITHEMKRRYSHVRIEVRRDAVQRLGRTQDQAATRTCLGNEDVFDLLKAGLPADIVAEKIAVSQCSFDTTPQALKRMMASGIPAGVVKAMVRAR